MKIFSDRAVSLTGVLMLAVFATPSWLLAAKVETEEALISELGSPKTGVVTKALQRLQKDYRNSPAALTAIKGLLTDSRSEVRCKAALVLGAMHAEVSEDDIKAVCALLKASDRKEVDDGLTALRGLNAPSAVPVILPLLKDPNSHIVCNACRTLAVLGNKDVIPSIEPLLSSRDKAVCKEANGAILKLRQKS